GDALPDAARARPFHRRYAAQGPPASPCPRRAADGRGGVCLQDAARPVADRDVPRALRGAGRAGRHGRGALRHCLFPHGRLPDRRLEGAAPSPRRQPGLKTPMRVLSGIQPTGNIHLGNYLGAIRNWVSMQDEMTGDSRCFFFLADMHSITVHETREQRLANVRDMTAALVACGIDPDRSVLFNQARVPAHAELCWLLCGTARIGWLNRMTQFKDKAGKNREGASVGLYVYPVLQAADVLL